jgi:hypothetical protein
VLVLLGMLYKSSLIRESLYFLSLEKNWILFFSKLYYTWKVEEVVSVVDPAFAFLPHPDADDG